MKFVVVLVMLLASVIAAAASDTATQTITYEVAAINVIAVHGSPQQMRIAPGKDATDRSTSYALTTNQDNKKIMVALSSPPPEGVVLKVSLAAPAGAKSLGEVAYTGAPVDAVVGVSRLAEKGLAITYKATASSREVTFTPGKAILTITDM